MQIGDTLTASDDGWTLTETGWDEDRAVAVASNFMVGNGYLGYRGTSPEQRAIDFVALVVSDTYDCADGHWRELTTAPNPLYVAARVEGRSVGVADAAHVETSLAMRTGEFRLRYGEAVDADIDVAVSVERFASYDDLHLVGQRWTLTSDEPVAVALEYGIDADIWSLNGAHLPDVVSGIDGDVLTAAGTTIESGVDVVVAARSIVHGATVTDQDVDLESGALRRCTAHLDGSNEVTLETIAAVYSSNDSADPMAAAVEALHTVNPDGIEFARNASRQRWADIWEAMDVRLEGHPVDQAALRFAAYHNRICTPAHTDHLPIGARGLSCQAYQGAAFWDQEVYNLPSFLFSEPEIARSILVYRHATLDGARRKARRLGYAGAYYAWISGDTGDELCPDHFFTDVLTGRPIRNHFNIWQIHVAPDVVTTVQRYVEVTGDTEFLADHGAEIAFEVARFLWSFVRYDEYRGTYHCIRLLGPDEWHENVDDNAFTNHQAHRALSFAIDTHRWMADNAPDRLAVVSDRMGLLTSEVDAWVRIRDRLHLPGPDPESGLIEQFAGFFELEDITPGELAERLLDPTEYWGWPNGIAVSTQVSKQADVPMLLWLHRGEYDGSVKRANYDYYEPRCSHNSSLSHAAFGMVAADLDDAATAYEHFRGTALVDLLNTNHPVVGGTFIGGIHTAACGGTLQLAVNGMGGLGFEHGRLTVDPALPDEWEALTYPIRWRGNRLTVAVSHDNIEVAASADNPDTVTVAVRGTDIDVAPGRHALLA